VLPELPVSPTTDSIRQRAKQHIEKFRDQLAGVDSLPQLTILGLLTGIVAGVVIVFFRWFIEIPLGLLLPDNFENFEAITPFWHFILPLTGALVLGSILQFADKRHHATGVAHVIDRLQNHQGRLPLGNVSLQFWGGIASLLTGQSVGREGPAVHLGAGSGSLLGQWLKLPSNSLRPLAGCGVAAAIAACFNTPMAGVIFAMEVVVMEYSISGFIPVILAAVAGTTISHLAFGNIINFASLHKDMGDLLELPFLIIAGFFIAFLAAAYIRLQCLWTRLSLDRPILLRFAIAGLITGCGAYFFPEVLGVGYDTIERALDGQMGFWLLIGIVLIKLCVTSVALGVGIPGGVIGPLLFIGACAGGAIGIIANWVMPESSSAIGFYVILGMGAMMGATLNAPLASMIAIIELTYNPGIIFPCMLMVVIACLTTRWAFRCDGLFEALLKIQDKFRTPEIAEQLLSKTGVRQLLDRHIKLCGNTLSYTEATAILNNRPHWLVLNNKTQLLSASDLAAQIAMHQQLHSNTSTMNGDSSTNTLDPALERITINVLDIPARRLDLIEVAPEANLFEALTAMNNAQVEAAYITTQPDTVIGIITREKINNYYRL